MAKANRLSITGIQNRYKTRGWLSRRLLEPLGLDEHYKPRKLGEKRYNLLMVAPLI
jgi:hypothetical protein